MEVMSGVGEQDLALVVRSAVAGDEVAFTRIVAAHHDDLRLVAAYITRDHALAEDAVQAAGKIAYRFDLARGGPRGAGLGHRCPAIRDHLHAQCTQGAQVFFGDIGSLGHNHGIIAGIII
mgnify:CR=1 FL=1